jgi:hypothetical protein
MVHKNHTAYADTFRRYRATLFTRENRRRKFQTKNRDKNDRNQPAVTRRTSAGEHPRNQTPQISGHFQLDARLGSGTRQRRSDGSQSEVFRWEEMTLREQFKHMSDNEFAVFLESLRENMRGAQHDLLEMYRGYGFDINQDYGVKATIQEVV